MTRRQARLSRKNDRLNLVQQAADDNTLFMGIVYLNPQKYIDIQAFSYYNPHILSTTVDMKKHVAKTISIMELLERFDTEEKAVHWFEEVLWNHKRVCMHCSCADRISRAKAKNHTYWCGDCRKHFTVRNGTIMQSSKLSLRKWAVAIYYVLTARKGISSLQLSKELSMTQKTAWHLGHRIREACSQDGSLVSGIVEADETYIGGKETNKHNDKKLKAGRGAVGKTAVMGMRERGGRVQAMPISKADKATLQGKIVRHVKAGSTVYTDNHRGYIGLQGFYYQSVNHSAREYVNGMVHTNGIESVWALLKRGYNGVYHSFSKKHLGRYVNEVTFRLNEGNVSRDTQDRMKSLCKSMTGKRLPYAELVK